MIIIQSEYCLSRVKFYKARLSTEPRLTEIVAGALFIELVNDTRESFGCHVFHIEAFAIYVCAGALRAVDRKRIGNRPLDKMLSHVNPGVLGCQFLIGLRFLPFLVSVTGLENDLAGNRCGYIAPTANTYSLSGGSYIFV